MLRGDTIAAVSTPPGRGGIGVIRLSGTRSLEIAAQIFRSPAKTFTPNRAQFGRVVDARSGDPARDASTHASDESIDPAPNSEVIGEVIGEVIDEAVMTYFRAPSSYTGEDVVELSCHGSPVVLRRVLDLLLARGARLAEPGEFTFRAFLNRRLDLAQAQAVRDLINAQTAYQARLATRQLEGAMSKRLTPMKKALLEIIVHMESAVEFVEDDISPASLARLRETLEGIINGLRQVASTFEFGRFVSEGFALAIVGRPNVGKSSVFNRLVGSDRAIVTALPGTTRDALYESAAVAGVPVRLIDTAGIRETEDLVEAIGITRSRAAIADADIVLVVLDNSAGLTGDDLRLFEEIPEAGRILALNKSDLAHRVEQSNKTELSGAVRISALTGDGFDELREAIFKHLSGDAGVERDDILITDARQQQAIRAALGELEQARDLLALGELEEVVLLKLHAALSSLGDITGETLTDDILGQIFSTFCIGK